jgi:RimJ/RimL family protein N-acetyltransferase
MFLEPPSEDRAHEREILKAYIERIYGLYGFGYWAVLAMDPAAPGTMDPLAPGTLIGRIGFSAVTADKEAQAAALGVSGIDADFGFLVAASCRGTGIAQEVCEALLRSGFECLGFLRVSADADPRNGASIRLLQKLGFTAVGRSDGKIFFIRDA